MNNPNVRILDITDFKQIYAFVKSKKKISHIPNENFDWENWSKGIKAALIVPGNSNVIGSFEDGWLKGLAVQSFALRSAMWYLTLVVQDSEGWLDNGHGTHVNNCLSRAVEIAEERGCFDVIYNVPVKWLRTTARTYPRSPIWSRYNIYIEEIVPAGREPSYMSYKYLYGQIRDHDVAVKKASLKMENRLAYFEKQGYKIDTLVESPSQGK
jgi:hypothetical protein